MRNVKVSLRSQWISPSQIQVQDQTVQGLTPAEVDIKLGQRKYKTWPNHPTRGLDQIGIPHFTNILNHISFYSIKLNMITLRI